MGTSGLTVPSVWLAEALEVVRLLPRLMPNKVKVIMGLALRTTIEIMGAVVVPLIRVVEFVQGQAVDTVLVVTMARRLVLVVLKLKVVAPMVEAACPPFTLVLAEAARMMVVLKDELVVTELVGLVVAS